MSRIAQEIKRARRAAGLTSRELAEAVTLTPQYVRLIECGGALPSLDATLKICSQFPDEDSAVWCWALLSDLWGEPVAEMLRRSARAADPVS